MGMRGERAPNHEAGSPSCQSATDRADHVPGHDRGVTAANVLEYRPSGAHGQVGEEAEKGNSQKEADCTGHVRTKQEQTTVGVSLSTPKPPPQLPLRQEPVGRQPAARHPSAVITAGCPYLLPACCRPSRRTGPPENLQIGHVEAPACTIGRRTSGADTFRCQPTNEGVPEPRPERGRRDFNFSSAWLTLRFSSAGCEPGCEDDAPGPSLQQ